jgi:predicted nucleic acid-binding protein
VLFDSDVIIEILRGDPRIVDALIAAVATMSGLRLWTLNRRHYPMEELEFYEPSG